MSRRSYSVIAALGLAVVAACDRAIQGGSDVAPAPTAVNCADATQLRQRALDDRRRVAGTRSDQERIVGTNRATFFAALATIADLKCEVTLAEADEALKPAFEAARKAEVTRSFYEGAVHWGEAGFIAGQVVPMLIKELSGQAQWIGKWFGPEGTFVDISKDAGQYRIIISNLDGPRTFQGVADGGRVVFERDGVRESLRAGTGAETGMKWLLEKKDCLVVKPGEGYCRG